MPGFTYGLPVVIADVGIEVKMSLHEIAVARYFTGAYLVPNKSNNNKKCAKIMFSHDF